MELKQFFRIIIKRLWIIILLPVILGTAAAYYSYYMLQPVYQANTTLYVMNNDPQYGINYSVLMAGEYLVRDYQELAKSRAVTERVIKDMGLKGYSPDGLASKIRVISKTQTRVIGIVVTDTNPQMAKEIADKVSEVFVEKAKELMKIDTVNIIDLAQVPWMPVEPNPQRNITVAAFIGLALAAGIVFLIEYLDDSIKTPEDVEKYLGLNVLGIVPVFSIK